MSHLCAAAGRKFSVAFAARDVILRSDGRIRYLRLSSRKQVLAVTGLTLLSIAAIGASAGMVVQRLSMHSQEAAVRKADDAYSQLLKDVTGYFDQFSRSANAASASETYLLGLSDEDSAARRKLLTSDQLHFWNLAGLDPAEQEVLRAKLRRALQEKLDSFDNDLQRIAARNEALTQQIADANAKAADLGAKRDALVAERDALAKQLTEQQAANQSLTGQVAQLTGTVGQLDAQLQIQSGKSQSLATQLGDLQLQLDQSKMANADLARQVEQGTRALASVVAQRNQLQTARTDMAGTVEDLKSRLASLQESQADFVSHLTERARQNLEDMEKTVQMTGLSVDQLLRRTDQDGAGQGGPFIPAPTDTKDANERKLLESVATLDDEVGRWEKLQVILRSIPLSAPVDHYYISSGFGERMDPFNGESAIHEGLDLVDAIRSDVLATAPGKVVFAGWRGSYGRCVEIDHGLGIHTVYAHLDSVLVKEGDLVDYRQTIGKLGNSGRSSGAHVHYEVRFEDKPLDPMGFLKAGRYVFKG
jgi:murein DD-endopeptidase MepM/ murein hydrolase activator NlpD